MSKCKELTWPGLMLAASSINLIGACVAVGVGADRTVDGRVNPFFYTAMATSSLYAVANGIKVYEIMNEPVKSFTGTIERERKTITEMREVVIERT